MNSLVSRCSVLLARMALPGTSVAAAGQRRIYIAPDDHTNPNVLLWALKPADDGVSKGLISRVWNLSSKQRQYSMSLAPGITAAMRVAHVETDIGQVPVTGGKIELRAARSQIQTLRMLPAKATK